MPRTRSGFDTSNYTTDSNKSANDTRTRRGSRKRRGCELPGLNTKNSKSKSQINQAHDAEYYLEQLKSGRPLLENYLDKVFGQDDDDDDCLECVNKKLSEENRSYLKRIEVNGAPEEVALFIEGYWHPLVNFQKLENCEYTERDEISDYDFRKRLNPRSNEGWWTEWKAMESHLNQELNSKKLDELAFTYCYELKNALLTVTKLKVLEDDMWETNPDQLLNTLKRIVKDGKHAQPPLVSSKRKINLKKLEEKLAKSKTEVDKYRRILCKIMNGFSSVHTNLTFQYRNLTESLRTLRIGAGLLARSPNCKAKVGLSGVETRRNKKLLTKVSAQMSAEEQQHWIKVLENIQKVYKTIYNKLARIHSLNIQIFAEIAIQELSHVIQHSKLVMQKLFDDKLPKQSYRSLSRDCGRRKSGEQPNETNTELQSNCTICLCDFDDNWKKEIRQLKCKHVYHDSCIDAWLRTGRRSCPFCREPVFEANDAYMLLDLSEMEIINRNLDDLEAQIQTTLEDHREPEDREYTASEMLNQPPRRFLDLNDDSLFVDSEEENQWREITESDRTSTIYPSEIIGQIDAELARHGGGTFGEPRFF